MFDLWEHSSKAEFLAPVRKNLEIPEDEGSIPSVPI